MLKCITQEAKRDRYCLMFVLSHEENAFAEFSNSLHVVSIKARLKQFQFVFILFRKLSPAVISYSGVAQTIKENEIAHFLADN